MVRGEDSLFRTRDGNPADADANVSVASGRLEGSTENMVESMVNMITLARQFDMQMKMLQTADNNAKSASSVLSISG
jgi:flagellar basal-body rod protein FlgF